MLKLMMLRTQDFLKMTQRTNKKFILENKRLRILRIKTLKTIP